MLFSESKNHVQKCCPDKESIALGRSRVSETTGGSSLPTPSTAPCLNDSPANFAVQLDYSDRLIDSFLANGRVHAMFW